MTAGERTPSRQTMSASAWLILLALLLYAWTHRHAFQMTGFAEDVGLVQSLVAAANAGDLASEVIPRWVGPLWGPESTMWRPWAFTSLALDAKIYGAASGWWHVTNLLLHLIAAVFTALLAREWFGSRWAAVAAFATMLLHPWSSESTLWLVGRFDGWVTAAIAAALYFSWRSRGIDRWWFAAVLASGLAYLSKESALVLLPATAMLVVCKAQAQLPLGTRLSMAQLMKPLAPILGAQLLVAATYFTLRWLAVGAVSTNVYGSNAVTGLGDLVSRAIAHVSAFISLGRVSPLAATSAALLMSWALIAAISARRWSVLVFAAVWVALVFSGAALHFSAPVNFGDGFRLYYLALVGIALVVAVSTSLLNASHPRRAAMFVVAWSVSLAIWQNASNGQWWRAAKEIASSAEAIGKTLPTLAESEYALVLLPEQIGVVPALRNAQGSIVRAAPARSAGADNIDYMVGFSPTQLDEWHRSMQKDIVRLVTKRADAPPRPTRYYCKEQGVDELRYLGFWEAGTLDEWRERWRTATRVACPSLKL